LHNISFFQTLFDQDHSREGNLLQEMVLAMRFLIKNNNKKLGKRLMNLLMSLKSLNFKTR